MLQILEILEKIVRLRNYYTKNHRIKITLAQAATIRPPTASLHLFRFQNASFFILLALKYY
jgi:hypothetical protein